MNHYFLEIGKPPVVPVMEALASAAQNGEKGQQNTDGMNMADVSNLALRVQLETALRH